MWSKALLNAWKIRIRGKILLNNGEELGEGDITRKRKKPKLGVHKAGIED
jgi:hypothetical protein